ncbi:C10 family peptidase [Runella slithyformis]|uniref:Peptidase C10 streptopain n=1 Tax=Runella slithyformis (strain ATCC 29530 / DSM 19594 / LMG 11500 / NCIMB 11436 / LSU 4) TaxID=761193 RepID=A0A7U4E774_RUNSL|nr:C10 family peptidase [Runella slithyformis]AEI50366.1 peptidase C10 streptopain [Runella slithyformis DSM 19594]
MKKIFIHSLIVSFAIALTSCREEPVITEVQQESRKIEYQVSQKEALLVASKHINFSAKEVRNLKNTRIGREGNPFLDTGTKQVKEILTHRKEDIDVFHVINFLDSGFVVVAADRRITPILAYSNNNCFGDERLSGIADWVFAIEENIFKTIRDVKEPRPQEAKLWKLYENSINNTNKRINDECPTCDQTWSFSTGQFVDPIARWGQSWGYSWYSPHDGGCNCGRKTTGCGPTAMAMVMNYHRHPQMQMSFNGDNITTNYPMPQQINVTCDFLPDLNQRQVSMLMRLCGGFANSGYGVFGNCNTWTYPGNINNAFANMGYSQGGTWGGLNSQYNNVKNDLSNRFPVLFTGTLNLVNANDAHIWVGDGYSNFAYLYPISYYDEYGYYQCNCGSGLVEYISMNWGQNGVSNGFYLANYSFAYCGNAGCDTYDTYLRALTGIRP